MTNRAEKSPANPKTIIDSIEGFWLIWESNHGADSRATQSILRFAKSERQFLDAWLVPFADQLASVLDFGGFLVIALGKLGRGGTKDELAKPLIAVQRVQLPPDQSRADRSVVSVAIHRATGGCEAYTTRK